MFSKLIKYLSPNNKDYRPSSEQELKIIKEKLELLKNNLEEIETQLNEKPWAIEKVIIENLHTEKIELNLESIDVKELSGMLSIGMNYGGSMTKVEVKKEKKKEHNEKEPPRTKEHSQKTRQEQKNNVSQGNDTNPKVNLNYK